MVERLHQRAARHHRSLQGELMAIIQRSAGAGERLAAEQALSEVRKLGWRMPSEAAEMIRADRDGR